MWDELLVIFVYFTVAVLFIAGISLIQTGDLLFGWICVILGSMVYIFAGSRIKK